DVLLKHRDGRFTGIQVKTRESDQPVWKSSDDQVKKAFVRFVHLDSEYPEYFRKFRFLSNHPFHTASNAQSLGYVLSQIREKPTIGDLPSPVARWLRGIARDAEVSEISAFRSLKKADASSDLPKLSDAFMRLIQSLTTCWSTAAECSHEAV